MASEHEHRWGIFLGPGEDTVQMVCTIPGCHASKEEKLKPTKEERQIAKLEQQLAQAREEVQGARRAYQQMDREKLAVEQRNDWLDRENAQARALLERVQAVGLVEHAGSLDLDISAFLAEHKE